MPEIAPAIGELDGYLFFPAQIRPHINDPAFSLFFGKAVHEQNLLPALNARREWYQPPINANGLGHCDIAEWTVTRRSSVDPHWNVQRQTLRAASFDHHDLLTAPGMNGAQTCTNRNLVERQVQ